MALGQRHLAGFAKPVSHSTCALFSTLAFLVSTGEAPDVVLMLVYLFLVLDWLLSVIWTAWTVSGFEGIVDGLALIPVTASYSGS